MVHLSHLYMTTGKTIALTTWTFVGQVMSLHFNTLSRFCCGPHFIRTLHSRRTDVEAETPILWPPDAKNWLIWKNPDAGKDWRQEEKGTTEDEMVGWHHWLNGHEFGWTLGVGDRQGDSECYVWSIGSQRVGQDWATELNWTSLWPIHLGWPFMAWLMASLSYTSPFTMTRLWSMKGTIWSSSKHCLYTWFPKYTQSSCV